MSITNLELRHTANELAFETVAKSNIELDAAVSAKAVELTLTAAQYEPFKRDVNTFRQMYAQSQTLDLQAAQRAAAATPAPQSSSAPENAVAKPATI